MHCSLQRTTRRVYIEMELALTEIFLYSYLWKQFIKAKKVTYMENCSRGDLLAAMKSFHCWLMSAGTAEGAKVGWDSTGMTGRGAASSGAGFSSASLRVRSAPNSPKAAVSSRSATLAPDDRRASSAQHNNSLMRRCQSLAHATVKYHYRDSETYTSSTTNDFHV